MCRSLHAEQNCIINASRNDMIDSDLYLYGMDAISEFVSDCQKEKEELDDETVIYQVMKYKANILKNRYLMNKNTLDK